MVFEVELKAHLRNRQEIEDRVARLGTLVEETFKEDVYFRRRGDTSPLPRDYYRLRREADQATVTFKQPVERGGTEVNKEVEFQVGDAHAFFRFTNRFGFEPFVIKRKKARVYQIGRARVELNEVEHLGHFIEIEILSDEEAHLPAARTEVARLLTELGLTHTDLEPRRYIKLIQEAYPVRYRFVDDSSMDWPFVEIT